MNKRNRVISEDLENIYARDIPWENLRDSTVLVTGAYGMLASYVTFMLLFLNEEKHMNIRIIAMVRSEEKFRKRFGAYADAAYMTVRTDSLDCAVSMKEDADYIIHAAGCADPQYYSVCPADVIKPNVAGSCHLLEFAARRRVKGFLMFSTGDVYGVIKGSKYVCEEDMGIVDPLDIHSCYSESKRMAETMCMAYFYQYGVPVKILRIWHTYAPTMDMENDSRVFASFVRNAVRGENIIMKSSGTSRRSFCYIADAVAGYFLVLLKGKAGEAYNVCNTEEFLTVRELAGIAASLRPELHLAVEIRKRSADEHYTENTAIGDAPPSDRKLRKLGWRPQYTAAEGFKRVMEAAAGREDSYENA